MSPVWSEGTLHIEMGDNVYGQAGFRLVGMKAYPLPILIVARPTASPSMSHEP